MMPSKLSTFESNEVRILEHAARRLDDGEDVPLSLLKDAVAFVRASEEAAYKAGELDDSRPPLTACLQEHAAAWPLLKAMEESLPALAHDDAIATSRFVHAADEYVAQRREHLRVDDRLFADRGDGPPARRRIGAAGSSRSSLRVLARSTIGSLKPRQSPTSVYRRASPLRGADPPANERGGSFGAMRIGLLTGGGDAPGLNAVIRGVVKAAANQGIETIGIEDGFRGLIGSNRCRTLSLSDVTGILRQGGTILGTTNHGNPLAFPQANGEMQECRQRASSVSARSRSRPSSLLAATARSRSRTSSTSAGCRSSGSRRPSTTTWWRPRATVGLIRAVAIATAAVDRLHTTAEAHHRIMVLEVMPDATPGGSRCTRGSPAVRTLFFSRRFLTPWSEWPSGCYAGKDGGAFQHHRVAEGAAAVGGNYAIAQRGSASAAERLGGIGAQVAAELEQLTGRESRSVLLGHLQRGGEPTSVDRILGTRFGTTAVEFAVAGHHGTMVSSCASRIAAVPLERVVGRTKLVPPDRNTVRSARGRIDFGG